MYIYLNKNKNMKNIYLIFPNTNDVFSYCKIECERKDFIDSLIESELIESWDDMKSLSWVIFENGELRNCLDFV